MNRDEAGLFFRLLTRRYEKASTIITSSKSFVDWGEIFNDQVLATAILDRLLYHCTTLNIKGGSYRLKEKRKAGVFGPSPKNQSKRMGLVSNIIDDEKGTFYSDEKGTKKNDVDTDKRYSSNFMYFLVNIFFFFLLLPFLSPIPIAATDTQPVSGLIAFIIIMSIFSLRPKEIKFSKLDIAFILFAFFSLLFIIPDYGEFIFQKRLSLLYAFFLFWTIRKYHYMFNVKVFVLVVTFNFITVLFHFLAPEFFIALFGRFVRTIKITEFSVRGASGLAAEPGFMASLSIFYFFVLYYFKCLRLISKTTASAIMIMLVIIILMTKSGTGVFVGISFLVCYLLESGRIKTIIFLFLMVITLSLLELNFGRGFSLLNIIINNPTLIFQDASVLHRIHNIIIGWLSLMHYPLGLGGGSFAYANQILSDSYNFEKIYGPCKIDLGQLGDVITSSRYLVEHGILFVLFVVLLFKQINKTPKFYLHKTITLYILFCVLFYPLAYPNVWFLLGTIAVYQRMCDFKPNRKSRY